MCTHINSKGTHRTGVSWGHTEHFVFSKFLLIVIKQGRKHKFISAIFFHRSSSVSNTDVSFNNVKKKKELKVYLARLLENKAFFLVICKGRKKINVFICALMFIYHL